IEKRETSGSEMQRVGCEVHLSTEYSSLELDSTISAVTESLEHGIQSREEEDVGCSIPGKILLQPEVTSIIAKCALFQALKFMRIVMVEVSARRESVNCVDDEVGVIEKCVARPDPLCGRAEYRGKLIDRDRFATEFAGGAASHDDLFDGVGR